MIGVIELNSDERIDPGRWIAIINDHASLSSIPPQEGTNPFTGKPTVFHAPETSARVFAEDKHIGGLEWYQDDSNVGLIVKSKSHEDDDMSKLMEVVNDIAHQLDGTFKTMEELENG